MNSMAACKNWGPFLWLSLHKKASAETLEAPSSEVGSLCWIHSHWYSCCGFPRTVGALITANIMVPCPYCAKITIASFTSNIPENDIGKYSSSLS